MGDLIPHARFSRRPRCATAWRPAWRGCRVGGGRRVLARAQSGPEPDEEREALYKLARALLAGAAGSRGEGLCAYDGGILRRRHRVRSWRRRSRRGDVSLMRR